MSVQTLEILKGYITCEDPATRNKFFNLLESFWHKADGMVMKNYTVNQNGDKTFVFLDKDGNQESITLPALPNSKPISFITGLESALNNLVTKVPGKGLSTNNLTTELLQKINSLQNYQHPQFHQIAEIENLAEALDDLRAPDGFGFSEENFSTALFQKLQQYNSDHYGNPVVDLDALAAIPNTTYKTNQRHYVESERCDYFYDAQAVEGDVAPLDQVDGTGFWIKGSLSQIAVKDENGIEKFKFKESVRFKGFNFNASTKTIEVIKKLKEVVVQDKAQLLGDLQSDVLYVIDGYFALGDGEAITVPPGGLNIMGYSFDASNISSYGIANHAIFDSPAEGSGNLIIHNIAFTTTGAGSKVFDIVDSDGSHAVEMVTVNFEGCQAIGKMRNYRQGTGITIGFYGCKEGLILSGAWNGFKLTNTNCFGFDAAGTLFKKDVDTVFSNRLFLELNMDLPAGAKLIDFDESNFEVNDLLQFNSTILKYDGLIDDANAEAAIPNIRANNPKCLWRSNVGIPDTAIEKFVDAEVVDDFAIDWLNDTFNIVMTGDTTFTDKNLPASGKSTKEIQIYLTGEFTPTFPAGWKANQVGTYKGSEVNKITLKFIKAGLYFMKIDNSLTIYPAPSLGSVVPAGLLPQLTQELILRGSFFTPESIVKIEGQTVESTEFDNDTGSLRLFVTTGTVEGDFDIFVSNGTGRTFKNKLTIALGEIFIPTSADWVDVTGSINLEDTAEAKVEDYKVIGRATWSQIFDTSRDFSVRFRFSVPPSLNDSGHNDSYTPLFSLIKTSDGTDQFWIGHTGNGLDNPAYVRTKSAAGTTGNVPAVSNGAYHLYEFRFVGGVMRFYQDIDILRTTFSSDVIDSNLQLKVMVRAVDIIDIKYIELATQQ